MISRAKTQPVVKWLVCFEKEMIAFTVHLNLLNFSISNSSALKIDLDQERQRMRPLTELLGTAQYL